MDTTTTTPAPAAPNGESVTPANFEAYLETQTDDVKALYNAHSEALLNTVRATRQERDTMAKQLRELAKQQAEGSDARKQLDELGAKLERTERRAAFLEDAPSAQCKNAKAAWLLAEAGNLFDKHGRPDWAAIRAEAPELFGQAAANANAGTGTGKTPPSAKNMNEFIRAASGRR
jgi:predicted metalloendopeptidase